jgi:hypothetical protein
MAELPVPLIISEDFVASVILTAWQGTVEKLYMRQYL